MGNYNDKNKVNSGELLLGNAKDNPEPSQVLVYTKLNKPKSKQTAHPSKYPQGYFKPKACKKCSKIFTPKAPSECYCSDACKDEATIDHYLTREYGVTYADYVRMYAEQKGRCKICGGEGFKVKECHIIKLVLDHDHKTGKVRGLLCPSCNKALGLFKDNPEWLRNAQQYLKGATTIM